MSNAAPHPTPAAPACASCTRTAQQLQGMPERWECSHVACPLRRPLTAAPTPRPLRQDGDGCWRSRFTYDD